MKSKSESDKNNEKVFISPILSISYEDILNALPVDPGQYYYIGTHAISCWVVQCYYEDTQAISLFPSPVLLCRYTGYFLSASSVFLRRYTG